MEAGSKVPSQEKTSGNRSDWIQRTPLRPLLPSNYEDRTSPPLTVTGLPYFIRFRLKAIESLGITHQMSKALLLYWRPVREPVHPRYAQNAQESVYPKGPSADQKLYEVETNPTRLSLSGPLRPLLPGAGRGGEPSIITPKPTSQSARQRRYSCIATPGRGGHLVQLQDHEGSLGTNLPGEWVHYFIRTSPPK